MQTIAKTLAVLQKQMQELAASLPEYPVVMQMYGIGPVLGPQLMWLFSPDPTIKKRALSPRLHTTQGLVRFYLPFH